METVDLTLRRSTNIHLFNLLDGSPHEVPLQKVLSLNSGYGFPLRALQQISGCRIALVAQTMDYREELNTTLIAWDWRTGAVVSFCFFAGDRFSLNLNLGARTLEL